MFLKTLDFTQSFEFMWNELKLNNIKYYNKI